MKARIKRYGQVIDVVQVETRQETDGIHTYYAEAGSEKLTRLCLWKDTELDFNVYEPSEQDWTTFRNEAAKFAMAAILSNWGHGFAGHIDSIPGDAVNLANKLVEELKK